MVIRNENMPLMAASAYASHTYNPGDDAWKHLVGDQNFGVRAIENNAFAQKRAEHLQKFLTQQTIVEEDKLATRMVKVYIADPDENLPLDQRVLYTGEEKLTDLTDQELFFELDIKGVLEKHNEARIKIVNKKVKERTEYLEPAKIRDLKMVVVTVATF